MDKIYCEICKQDITRKDRANYGEGQICMPCNNTLFKTKNVDSVNISQPVIFKSKVTKLGKGRKHVEIPRKLRDFLAYNKDYIIIIKNLEVDK